jgi:uncharacterized SAM-binding protein YcdF (DUF218 family)
MAGNRSRRLLIALVVIVLIFGGLAWFGFVRPPTAPVPRTADAVVVLAGDHGDRLARARAIVRQRSIAVLVILNPRDGTQASVDACRAPASYEVRCLTPSPVTTVGDGRALRDLVEREGWRRVIVVTSRFHVLRARLILSRCTNVSTIIVGSDPPYGARQWLRSIRHEIAGTVAALTLSRRC